MNLTLLHPGFLTPVGGGVSFTEKTERLSMKNKTVFHWRCERCRKRNSEVFQANFSVPDTHGQWVKCSGCSHIYAMWLELSMETVKMYELRQSRPGL